MRAITVVTPCFNEELNVQECYEAVRNLFANELAAYRREHIFCDNASTDGTLAILRKIAAADRSVKMGARRFPPWASGAPESLRQAWFPFRLPKLQFS